MDQYALYSTVPIAVVPAQKAIWLQFCRNELRQVFRITSRNSHLGCRWKSQSLGRQDHINVERLGIGCRLSLLS